MYSIYVFKYSKIKQYCLCWIFLQVHNKMNKFQSNNVIKVTNNRCPAHSGLWHFCNNYVVFMPIKFKFKIFIVSTTTIYEIQQRPFWQCGLHYTTLHYTTHSSWEASRTTITKQNKTHWYIDICCCQFRCSGTGKRYSNRKETICVPLLNAGFEPGFPDTTDIASRLNARWQTDWAIEDQAKTWTRQPVPMISEHSAHLTPLSVDFRTWLWRNTYLLLLISMLWHRQAIFKSKGDKLCSSAECKIWTRGPRHQIVSRLTARWQTDWAIEDQAKTWTRQPVPMISEHSAHLTPMSVDGGGGGGGGLRFRHFRSTVPPQVLRLMEDNNLRFEKRPAHLRL